MARVTVEDCIDKVPNRFELVLLASHRAVVALREIAEQTVSPDDIKEAVIHAMQKYVEVDEPEPDEAPLASPESLSPVLAQDDQTSDLSIDRMTEEELLRGLESLASSESNAGQRTR